MSLKIILSSSLVFLCYNSTSAYLISWLFSPCKFYSGIQNFFFERERKSMHMHEWMGEGQRESNRLRERERERIPRVAQIHNCEIMTWAKIKSQTLKQLSHPGTPHILLIYFFLKPYLLFDLCLFNVKEPFFEIGLNLQNYAFLRILQHKHLF